MPSLKKLNITKGDIRQANRESLPVPYETQYYYSSVWGHKLAATCRTYLDGGSIGGGWNFIRAGVTEKHLRMVLMASRSYVINNPYEFDPEVVTLLEGSGFTKHGDELVLTPRNPNSNSLSRNKKLDLDLCFSLGTKMAPHEHLAQPFLQGDQQDQQSHQLKTVSPEFAIIIEDLKELIQSKPIDTVYVKEGITLSNDEQFEIRAMLSGAGVTIHRVEPNRVKALKTVDNLKPQQ